MPLFEHAIVIGGSMAGSLAARALADHAARVTVIERDLYPADATHRAGAPQSHHIHIMLMRGLELFEELMPGFSAALIAAGGREFDMTTDCPTYIYGAWVPPSKARLTSMVCSRPLIETVLRQLIMRRYPQITWNTQQRAVDLVIADGRVRGIEVQSTLDPAARQAPAERLDADLVVDASGRNSALPRWLERLGYALPPSTVVDSQVGYATRWFDPPAAARDVPWVGVIVRGRDNPTIRSGLISIAEGNRWIVTLAGCGGDYPPTDEAGFLAFAKTLPYPIIAQTIERSQPIAPIHGYRAMENRNRHYERLSPGPDGLIALGDAFCMLNPIYGHGMTMAALGAKTLADALDGADPRRPGWSNQFHRKLARQYRIPWSMATGEDYRVPGVQAPPAPRSMRLVHRYLDALLRACTSDGEVWRAFIQVAHLTKHPAHLIHPRIVWSVARSGAAKQTPAASARPAPSLPAG